MLKQNVGREYASRQVTRLCKMGMASQLAEKVEFMIAQMVAKKLDRVHNYMLEKGLEKEE
jgi:hypothetical protein